MQPMNKNDALHQLLLEATGLETKWTKDARANLFGWLKLEKPAQLADAAKAMAGKVRLCTVTAYAEERDDMDKRRRIAYHFADKDTVITVTVPLYDVETLQKLSVPSITPWFRNADWNEREFKEMYNIDIQGHPNPKRLFLDERLDAGIMTRLIPFSAMANSAGTNTLWERILEAKGVPPEERMPSLATPPEPIKVEPKVTPVSVGKEIPGGGPTLAGVAASADMAVSAKEAGQAGSDGVASSTEIPADKKDARPEAVSPAPVAESAPPKAPQEPIAATAKPTPEPAPVVQEEAVAQTAKADKPAPVAKAPVETSDAAPAVEAPQSADVPDAALTAEDTAPAKKTTAKASVKTPKKATAGKSKAKAAGKIKK